MQSSSPVASRTRARWANAGVPVGLALGAGLLAASCAKKEGGPSQTQTTSGGTTPAVAAEKPIKMPLSHFQGDLDKSSHVIILTRNRPRSYIPGQVDMGFEIIFPRSISTRTRTLRGCLVKQLLPKALFTSESIYAYFDEAMVEKLTDRAQGETGWNASAQKKLYDHVFDLSKSSRHRLAETSNPLAFGYEGYDGWTFAAGALKCESDDGTLEFLLDARLETAPEGLPSTLDLIAVEKLGADAPGNGVTSLDIRLGGEGGSKELFGQIECAFVDSTGAIVNSKIVSFSDTEKKHWSPDRRMPLGVLGNGKRTLLSRSALDAVDALSCIKNRALFRWPVTKSKAGAVGLEAVSLVFSPSKASASGGELPSFTTLFAAGPNPGAIPKGLRECEWYEGENPLGEAKPTYGTDITPYATMPMTRATFDRVSRLKCSLEGSVVAFEVRKSEK